MQARVATNEKYPKSLYEEIAPWPKALDQRRCARTHLGLHGLARAAGEVSCAAESIMVRTAKLIIRHVRCPKKPRKEWHLSEASRVPGGVESPHAYYGVCGSWCVEPHQQVLHLVNRSRDTM